LALQSATNKDTYTVVHVFMKRHLLFSVAV